MASVPLSGSDNSTVKSCLQKNYQTVNDMKDENIQCILTSGRTISELPSSSSPYMIIKYGPTGSGKGSEVVQKEIRLLGVPVENYAVFEIDSLVESIKMYRNQTMIIKQKRKMGEINTRKMYNNLSNAYFSTRKTKNHKSQKNLNTKMDDILQNAIKNSKNIIFETTGTYFSFSNPIKWLIDETLKINTNYKIVVIYPIVSVNELIKRVDKRAENQSTRKNKQLYRAINTSKIEAWASYSKMNLTHFLLPELFSKRIHKIIAVWNE